MFVTRFAPSPTGRLHLGHAYSAVLGGDRAREYSGAWRLRIEDLDETRSRPQFIDGICEDLRWLGLQWEEPVIVQSQRTNFYSNALERLKAKGLAYACFCTRADIAQSLTAPHGDAATSYPGTCRDLPDDPHRRASMPHCWRLNCAKALVVAGSPSWREAQGQHFTALISQMGDAILARKDAPASYHLACVVDDAESGVTLVVRGRDLRPSTPIQRLLQTLLGLPEPEYLHHSLVGHDDGRRLTKRDLAPNLAAMRATGLDGRALADRLREGRLPLGFTFLDA
jgi:glutamyl-Q tRNA(Asp) synthetase